MFLLLLPPAIQIAAVSGPFFAKCFTLKTAVIFGKRPVCIPRYHVAKLSFFQSIILPEYHAAKAL
jgi:hypothetical protein